MVRIHHPPPDYVPDFTVRHIFLSIHAGLRAFGRKIRETVLPWMSKAKSAAKPHKRGLCLIFQAGGPAFLRSAALFPAYKCVEVCACQIDRLTKAQNGPKSNPQNTRGWCALFQELSGWQAGEFFALPPLTLSP